MGLGQNLPGDHRPKKMQASTKAALKLATRQWEHEQGEYARQQQRLQRREQRRRLASSSTDSPSDVIFLDDELVDDDQITPEDHLKAKIKFLETVAKIYEKECQDLQARDRKTAVEVERGMTREIDVILDKHRSATVEVKRLQELLRTAAQDREETIARMTHDFQRVHARSQERHQLQVRSLKQEIETLTSKIDFLEESLKEQRTMGDASAAMENIERRYAADDAEARVVEDRAALKEEREQRLRLEDENTSLKHQLKRAVEFAQSLSGAVSTMDQLLRTTQERHVVLVEDLLSSSTGLEETNASAVANASAQDPELATNLSSHLAAVPDTPTRLSKLAAPDHAPASGSTTHAGHAHVGSANWWSKGYIVEIVDQFQRSLTQLAVVIESQHIELGLSVRCSRELFTQHATVAREKLMENYAHCQLLLARTGELERAVAEARDSSQRERDRALDQRDQVLLQLRARDAKERRVVRHVECQTVARIERSATFAGGVGSVALSDAANSGINAAGSGGSGTGGNASTVATAAGGGTSTSGGGGAPSAAQGGNTTSAKTGKT